MVIFCFKNPQIPITNSRSALEQLRKALADSSDTLFLMRNIRDTPSPLMDALPTSKKASETKGPIISVQASEKAQHIIKFILGNIDKLRATLIGLDKKVSEMKLIMRELQEA